MLYYLRGHRAPLLTSEMSPQLAPKLLVRALPAPPPPILATQSDPEPCWVVSVNRNKELQPLQGQSVHVDSGDFRAPPFSSDETPHCLRLVNPPGSSGNKRLGNKQRQ